MPSRRISCINGVRTVTTGPERPGLDKGPGSGENFGSEISPTMKLAPPVGQTFHEHRDIVVRRLVRIAARTGAEPHDAFDPIAVEFIEGSAEAPQDLIVDCGPVHCAGSAGSNPLDGSHSATPSTAFPIGTRSPVGVRMSASSRWSMTLSKKLERV
jgi:hypothetical protein